MSFFVYVLASERNGTLYIGMTDNLARRVWEHQSGAVPGFTRKYGVKTSCLVRTARVTRNRISTRTSDEKMESRVETSAH